MTYKLSAAPLSYINTDIFSWIRACAHSGLDYLGIRLVRVNKTEYEIPLYPNNAVLRQMTSTLTSEGIEVLDIETLPLSESFNLEEVKNLLSAGEALGAHYLNVVGDDPNLNRFQNNLGLLADEAKSYGIKPVIEPIAYKCLNDYSKAIQIAKDTDCLVEFDGLHFIRTKGKITEVSKNADLFPIVQFCDANYEIPQFDNSIREKLGTDKKLSNEIIESRFLRLQTGAGDVPWQAILNALSKSTVIAIEIPNTLLSSQMSPEDYMTYQTHQAKVFLEKIS